ncbi:MAG TPA: flagellar basal body rod protein FlgB [Acidobacteriaceae bacterium]
MQVTTPLSDEATRYLDLSTQRMQLISSNMANVDTPGYRTQDIDFEGEFTRAADQVLAERMGSAEASQPAQVRQVGGLLERPDGNNVSLDRESLALGELQLKFRAATTLLKREFTRISDAIHADK